MFICCLYVVYGEVSVKVFGPVFDCIFCFLVEFESSFLFWIRAFLSDLCFVNIFSHPWLVFPFS